MANLTSCTLYANLDAGWTDLSTDVVGGLSASWGISGTTPKDRIAETGMLNFTLDNCAGYYTPGGAAVKAGWKKGTEVKVVMVYDGDSYTRFRGVVETIGFEVITDNIVLAHVTVVDWLNYAATHPMTTPALMLNTTADLALDSIITAMPNKPQEQNLEAGTNLFTSVFDITRQQSKAFSEFAKLNNSELGYLYLTKPAGTGEQLVFENAQHRNGLLPLTLIPKAATFYLLMETGDKLLQENNDKIYLNETESTALNFNTEITSLGITHGDNLANRVTMRVYPRRADSSPAILYQLGSATQIGAGETHSFRANYSDPNGGAQVGGMNMIVPVATTDYTLNTASDGTGTNLTATAVISVTFGATSAQVDVFNNSASDGYITLFNLRGTGLYTYNAVEYAAEEPESINTYGYAVRNFDQPYNNDLTFSRMQADSQAFIDRNPRVVLQAVHFCANRSSQALIAFLNYDIGSLIKITDTTMGTTGAYIIQGISFQVQSTKVVLVTYILTEHLSLLGSTMTSLSALCQVANPSALCYGYLHKTVQTYERSYAAWVYWTGVNGDGVMYTILSAPFSDGGGVIIYIINRGVGLYTNLFNVSPGTWSGTGVVENNWYHIAITYDTIDTTTNPIIYINGAPIVVNENTTPAGTRNSEYGANVVIGNWLTATQHFDQPFKGSLKDVRIYNRILTAAEVTTLYNAGTPNASLVTSGLVFQGPTIPAYEATAYNGKTLTSADKVLENIYRAAAFPNGTVVTSTWS